MESPVDGGGEFGALKDPSSLVFGSYGNTPEAPHGKTILVTQETSRCATDIALIVLDRTFDDPVLAPIRLDAPPAVGDSLTAVGYGSTSTGANQEGVRQERAVTVLALGPVPEDSTYPAVAPNFFVVGEALCSGDSGGPAIAASGAVVGVASYLNNPTVEFPTSTPSDCIGASVHDVYENTSADRALILSAYAAVQATLWLEGQPDPRAQLKDFAAACGDDGECKSNVCVTNPSGTKACSHSCLGGVACPTGYACNDDGTRQRCALEAVDLAPSVKEHNNTGCNIAISGSVPGPAVSLGVLFALRWRRRFRSRHRKKRLV